MTTDSRLIFSRTDLYAHYNQPKTRHLLAQIDGFSEISISAERCTQLADTPKPVSQQAFADRLLAGESLTDLATEYAEANRTRSDFDAATGFVLNTAKATHDQKVEEFARINQAEIQAGLLRELNRIKNETRALLPRLGDVTEAQDLVAHPDAAHAFAKFLDLVAEFDSWRIWHSVWFSIAKYSSANPHLEFADADIIKRLEQAWPDFHRAITDYDTNNSAKRGMPTCWPTSADLLRAIAEHDLEMWAPTSTQVDAERARLRALAEPLAKAEADRRRQS